MKLQDIGLGLLKFLSSHRGLTYVPKSFSGLLPVAPSPSTSLTCCSHELFDEYTRRQFLAKAPEKNPFGTEETPLRFADFDVFKKVRSGTWLNCLRNQTVVSLIPSRCWHIIDPCPATNDAIGHDAPRAPSGENTGTEGHRADKLGM